MSPYLKSELKGLSEDDVIVISHMLNKFFHSHHCLSLL